VDNYVKRQVNFVYGRLVTQPPYPITLAGCIPINEIIAQIPDGYRPKSIIKVWGRCGVISTSGSPRAVTSFETLINTDGTFYFLNTGNVAMSDLELNFGYEIT
jgi:hypothetical protein